MTVEKQYMKFEDFEKLIIEKGENKDEENTDKVYWKGGIGWGLKYDNWNVSISNTSKIGDSVTGTLYYYIAVLEGKDSKTHFQELSDYFGYLLDGISRYVGRPLTWKDQTKITPIETKYKYKDVYKLYEAKANFNIDISAIKDDAKEVKNRVKSIEWNAGDQVAERVKHSGVYIQYKLFVRSSARGLDSVQTVQKRKNNSKKNNENENEDNLKKATDMVQMMVESPDKFGGYNEMLGNLKQMINMSTSDFLAKYGNKGFVSAFIIKALLNLARRDKSTTPEFNPSKDNTSGIVSTEIKYTIPEASGKPNDMSYSMETSDAEGTTNFNPNDRLFKFVPAEPGDYTFTFYANNGAEMAGEFALTVKVAKPTWKKDFTELKFDMNEGGAYSEELEKYIDNFDKNVVKVETQEDQLSIGGNEVFIDNDTTLAVTNTSQKMNTQVNFKIIDKTTNKELDSKYINFVIESKNNLV